MSEECEMPILRFCLDDYNTATDCSHKNWEAFRSKLGTTQSAIIATSDESIPIPISRTRINR